MKRIFLSLIGISFFLAIGSTAWAGQRIEISPPTPYARCIVYETLGCFWIGIIGLIVIIRMKLRDIERSRKMGLDKEEKDAPLLSADDGRVAP
jgi:hypothetical protein